MPLARMGYDDHFMLMLISSFSSYISKILTDPKLLGWDVSRTRDTQRNGGGVKLNGATISPSSPSCRFRPRELLHWNVALILLLLIDLSNLLWGRCVLRTARSPAFRSRDHHDLEAGSITIPTSNHELRSHYCCGTAILYLTPPCHRGCMVRCMLRSP